MLHFDGDVVIRECKQNKHNGNIFFCKSYFLFVSSSHRYLLLINVSLCSLRAFSPLRKLETFNKHQSDQS